MRTMNKATRGTLLVVILAALCVPAVADMIQFSSESSDSTPAEYLDARVVYTFDPVLSQLSLEIFNDTATPFAYTISVLSFNVSNDVAGLSVQDDDGYSLSLSVPAGGQGGFGQFDRSVDMGIGNNGILAGQSALFVLNVTAAPASILGIDDFFSHSSIQAGEETGVAIMHFTRGPNDDSAWGLAGTNVVPEPASVLLLGIGAVSLAVARKRAAL